MSSVNVTRGQDKRDENKKSGDEKDHDNVDGEDDHETSDDKKSVDQDESNTRPQADTKMLTDVRQKRASPGNFTHQHFIEGLLVRKKKKIFLPSLILNLGE